MVCDTVTSATTSRWPLEWLLKTLYLTMTRDFDGTASLGYIADYSVPILWPLSSLTLSLLNISLNKFCAAAFFAADSKIGTYSASTLGLKIITHVNWYHKFNCKSSLVLYNKINVIFIFKYIL